MFDDRDKTTIGRDGCNAAVDGHNNNASADIHVQHEIAGSDETAGNVLPGSLLGPIVGLAFSSDGLLLFACSGSSICIYDVCSGLLLSTVRVFTPGVGVYGLDIGWDTREYLNNGDQKQHVFNSLVLVGLV